MNERVAIVWLLPCKICKRLQTGYTHYVVCGKGFIEDVGSLFVLARVFDPGESGSKQAQLGKSLRLTTGYVNNERCYQARRARG
jgi:hypothetical protein